MQCEATSRIRCAPRSRSASGARNIATRGTDHNGHLELDLAKAIPYDAAKKAVMVQVIVAGKVVGELDIEPILDAQEEMRREQEAAAWQQVDLRRCDTAPSTDAQACESVRAFLRRFPDGLHAEEARAVLQARERRQDKVIAGDEEVLINSTEKADACSDRCIKRCAAEGKGPKHPCVGICESKECK